MPVVSQSCKQDGNSKLRKSIRLDFQVVGWGEKRFLVSFLLEGHQSFARGLVAARVEFEPLLLARGVAERVGAAVVTDVLADALPGYLVQAGFAVDGAAVGYTA